MGTHVIPGRTASRRTRFTGCTTYYPKRYQVQGSILSAMVRSLLSPIPLVTFPLGPKYYLTVWSQSGSTQRYVQIQLRPLDMYNQHSLNRHKVRYHIHGSGIPTLFLLIHCIKLAFNCVYMPQHGRFSLQNGCSCLTVHLCQIFSSLRSSTGFSYC